MKKLITFVIVLIILLLGSVALARGGGFSSGGGGRSSGFSSSRSSSVSSSRGSGYSSSRGSTSSSSSSRGSGYGKGTIGSSSSRGTGFGTSHSLGWTTKQSVQTYLYRPSTVIYSSGPHFGYGYYNSPGWGMYEYYFWYHMMFAPHNNYSGAWNSNNQPVTCKADRECLASEYCNLNQTPGLCRSR